MATKPTKRTAPPEKDIWMHCNVGNGSAPYLLRYLMMDSTVMPAKRDALTRYMCCGCLRFPGTYPDLDYANALPVSQQGRRELYRKMQHDDGKVRTFADFVEEATDKQADDLGRLIGDEEQLMKQQQEKREEDDDWARLCLSKLHSKTIALEEAEEAKLKVAEAQRSLEAMRRRQEQLVAERDELAQLARRHEEAAARAAEEAAAARARKAPCRSATLTVEAAAAEGAPRRGASMLGRSRTVSMSRASLDLKEEGPSRAQTQEVSLEADPEVVGKTIHESFDVLPPKRLHTAIPQQGRRKGEILNNGSYGTCLSAATRLIPSRFLTAQK